MEVAESWSNREHVNHIAYFNIHLLHISNDPQRQAADPIPYYTVIVFLTNL